MLLLHHANGLLQNKELEVIFRRANFTENSEDSMQIMNYSEFIDSLCLIALHAFSKDDVKHKYPTTVDKLKALYAFMGFKVPSGGCSAPRLLCGSSAMPEGAPGSWRLLLPFPAPTSRQL